MTDSGTPPHRARAVALIVAMYLLARPVVVLVLVGLVVAPLIGQQEFLIVGVVWVIGGLASIFSGRRALPGRAVRPSDQPELVTLVRRVADLVDFRTPLLVRVVPTGDAAMTRAKVRGVDVSVLLLGWPLIRFLTEAQLAAVVAHELAHAESVRGRLSELAIRARASLVGSLDDRIAFPAAFKAGLLRSTQVDSWHEEQAADAVAAAVVGSATVQTTLERIRLIDSVWELIGGAVAEVLADEGAYPIDLYEVIEAAINDPVLDRRVRATAGREGESDPFAASTHPPLTMRIAMLPQQSGATRWMDRPVLFSGSEATEDWCVRTVFGVGARGPELSPTRALDGDLSRYENGLTEARGTLTAALGAPTWQEALPRAVSALTLDPGALGVLLDPDVRRLPQPLRADVAQRRAAGCVGAVIAAGLLDQGWQRVSPWTATVLEDPAGSEVDVVKTVHALVETRNAERLQELVDDAVGSRA